jgi:DNA polymerase-1
MRVPRVFLLDGLALAYRSHYAFIRRPLVNARGEHTSALFAFANTVIKLRTDEKPDYWALAWDAEGPTLRSQEFAEYKATRKPMPEELAAQLQPLKELAAALGLPLLEAPGYEADDVMATLARRAVEDGMEAVLVTSDKDLQQLVRPGVRVLSPRGRQGDEDLWLDEPEVEAKWGVKPASLRDLLALMGDTVDNVPGVPGIGEKTAAALIGRFGNLETLYARLGEVDRESLRKKLAQHREAAFFSRKLVTVQDDLPLEFGWERLTVRPPDAQKLQTLGERYELRRLLTWAEQVRSGSLAMAGAGGAMAGPGVPLAPVSPKTVTGARESAGPAGTASAAPAPPPARVASNEVVQSTLLFESETAVTLEPYGPPVRVIDTSRALEELVRELAACSGFVLDTETTSEEPMRAGLVGIGFTTGERPAYVPLAHREGNNLPFERVAEALGRLLADRDRPKLGQNLKYDALVLERAGLPVEGLAFDTMIASYLLDPEGSHGLDHLSRVHLGIEKIPTSALIGRGRGARTMDEVAIPLVAGYCGEDVHCAWLLAERFRPQIEARELGRLLDQVEMPLVTVLKDMECEGVLVDREFLGRMSKTLESELVRLEGLIFASAGGSFNINSGPQLSEILFRRLGLPARKKTQSGLSTDAFVLEELAVLHELPRLVLQYRQVAKLKSTYVDAIPALIHPDTGRVHTEFHQTVAATGRLSSSNPGLQNIPMRTLLGREVRKAFVARPGWQLVGADYSQIELRIMAHLSGDPALTEAFTEGRDVHAATAAQVFGLEDRAPTPDERAKAKVVNFGIMYGMGARALSLQMGITLAEASAFIRDYFRVHAGVKRFLDRTIEEVRDKGYVSTLLGRRRYLPDVASTSPRARSNAERAAINTPLQGSAADLVKVAMVRIHERLRREGSRARLVLQVHDELLLESPESEVARVEVVLAEEMVRAVTLSVPLEVSVGIGGNWFDVH